MILIFLTAILLGLVGAVPQNQRQNFPQCDATYPDPESCKDPCEAANDCSCFGKQPPVPLEDRPQIVYITFDDGLTKLAHDTYYTRLFEGNLKNPNGCPIRATHFVSHMYSDYILVNQYYNKGHEIAIHSITHRYNTTYWKLMNKEGWTDEMLGMRQIISKFSGIPESAMKGIRAPFLQGGGDEQFAMMKEHGFLYDCSMPTLKYGYLNQNQSVWPFTLDYKNNLDCQIEPCPQCSFPGVWVQSMSTLRDNRANECGPDGCPCSMLDSCLQDVEGVEETRKMLMKNFDDAYKGKTRAPLGYYVHAAWFFGNENRFEGYLAFLKDILQNKNVWVLPVITGIEYLKNPMSNDDLLSGKHPSFTCDAPDPQALCENTENCQFDHVNYPPELNDQTVYMGICKPDPADSCPDNYPWLKNPDGN